MTRNTVPDLQTFVNASLLPSIVADVRHFFAARGLHAFLVGGVVRDALLGRKTEDIDLAVETTGPGLLEAAGDLAEAFDGRFVLLNHERGAARVLVPDGPTLDFIAAPDGLARDLARRDFTVNAMAVL